MPITVEWQRLRFGQLIVGEIVGPSASVVLVGVVREVHVDAVIITAGSADVDVPRRVEVVWGERQRLVQYSRPQDCVQLPIAQVIRELEVDPQILEATYDLPELEEERGVVEFVRGGSASPECRSSSNGATSG